MDDQVLHLSLRACKALWLRIKVGRAGDWKVGDSSACLGVRTAVQGGDGGSLGSGGPEGLGASRLETAGPNQDHEETLGRRGVTRVGPENDRNGIVKRGSDHIGGCDAYLSFSSGLAGKSSGTLSSVALFVTEGWRLGVVAVFVGAGAGEGGRYTGRVSGWPVI